MSTIPARKPASFGDRARTGHRKEITLGILQKNRARSQHRLYRWEERFFAAVTAVFLAVVTVFSIWNTQVMPAHAASKDLYFDQDGNLCFESRDTKRTSGIGYETIGYTFHKANEDGSIDENGAYASMGFTGQKESVENSDGTITTIFYMDAANLQTAMNKVDPSGNWYRSFVSGNGTIYASAIMRTFTMTGGKKTPSGYVDVVNGELQYHGKVYDFHSIEALATAYNWAGSGADDIRYEHFRKKLNIKTPKKQDILNQQETDSKLDGDYAGWHMSGRTFPYVLTYHTDKTYDVGEGIPSGKSLTNGIVADDWYGCYAYSERSISDDFSLSYNISYSVKTKTTNTWIDDNGETHEEIEESVSSKQKTVEVETSRSARYYAIRSLQLYSYNGVIVSNDSYGKATYGNPYSLEWEALINGEAPTGADSYSPDDLAHINYEDAGDPGLDAGTFDHEPTEEELIAAASVQEDADMKRIEVTVRNDQLRVNEKTYMDGTDVTGTSTETVACPAPQDILCASASTVASRTKLDDGDFTIREEQTTQTVPKSKENGKYTTSLQATYLNVLSNSTEVTNKSGVETILKDTKAYESRTDVFEENEPVVVHTPVISPVSIYEGINTGSGKRNDTSKKATGTTQLVNTPPAEVDGMTLYTMRLDKTYTIQFDPYKWLSEEVRSGNMSEEKVTDLFGHSGFDLAGYGESGSPSKYDEYVQLKQVRFPFDVAWIDQSSGEEHYVYIKEDGYTDWIDIQSNDHYTISFYIPSWAKESTSKYGSSLSEYYKIQFRVEAYNTGSHKNATEDTLNSKLASYVATYDVPVNLSGWMYGFQIIGTNDKDMFHGYEEGASESTDFPFCLSKQEKKSGTLNRVGGTSMRYTLDGTLTKKWDTKNTTPMSAGSSLVYDKMGALWKGTTFSYSFKTIANLGDNDDTVSIRPNLRYYDKTLTLHPDVAIYYTDSSGKFIEYGSDRDTANRKTVVLANKQFEGSWYQGGKFLKEAGISEDSLGYQLPDDLTYTAEALGMTTEKFLNTKRTSYCLSDIKLDKNLRILSGHEEELERNLTTTQNQNDFHSLNARFSQEDGTTVAAKDSDTFKRSMQTWYGQYTIPNKLFVCDRADLEKVGDIDGDGDTDLDDYALKYPLSEDSDLWFTDGYLVLNFDIESQNGGTDHLKYSGGTDDMWQDEGSRQTVEVPSNGSTEGGTLRLRSGDIALVDLRYSVSDKYSAHIFMIN